MFDLDAQEYAIASILSGALAMIFGAVAIATSIEFFVGLAIGCGVWAVIYGVTAFVKK